MKRYLLFFVLASFVAVMLAACDTPAGSGNAASIASGNVVHMQATTFSPSSITIKKGEKITLVNDVAAVHIVQNGTWDSNGDAKPAVEPGAPKVQEQFQNGDSKTIGPFTTAGTFQIYCTVHPEMNLTVKVV